MGPLPISAPLRCPAAVAERVAAGPARYVVTGAGGWLGRATLEMLDEALGDRMAEAVAAYAASDRDYRLRSGRRIRIAALDRMADLAVGREPTFLAHFAFLTREKTADRPLDAYVRANRGITATVAREAARLGIAGTFTTSSGAVYGPGRTLAHALAENPYGVLKLEEEETFSRLADAMEIPAAICRVFNLAGPFINKPFALSSIIGAVLADRPIRLESARPVVRSYAHIRDVVAIGMAGMLGLTSRGNAPFDTAGAEPIELSDLAGRVRSVLGRPGLAIIRPPPLDDAGDRYVGNGAEFQARAAAAGFTLTPLDAQIVDTASFMATDLYLGRPAAP